MNSALQRTLKHCVDGGGEMLFYGFPNNRIKGKTSWGKINRVTMLSALLLPWN